MITGLIALIIVIAVLPPAIGDGNIGVIILVGVVVGFLLLWGYVGRKQDSAEWNWISYWAMDGKDRARARHRWEAEAREEALLGARYEVRAREPSREELEAARLKREAYMAELRRGPRFDLPEAYRVCHSCGRGSNVPGETVYTEEGRMAKFTCPMCGKMNLTKIR